MRLRRFLIITSLAIGSLAFAAPAVADNFVIPNPPVEGDGIDDGAAMRFGINKEQEDNGKASGISVRYFPHQHWIVSSTPNFSFDLRTLPTGTIAPFNLRWEVYQLKNGSAQDGNSIRRPVLFSGGGGLSNPFPATTAGRINGQGVNERFNSTAYPNYNGFYVFLVKGVSHLDLNNGYVTTLGPLDPDASDRTACPQELDGNVINCPTEDRYARLLQTYIISNPETNPDGKPQHLGSAPANISTTFRWSSNGGNDYDYEDVYYWAYGFPTAHPPGPNWQVYGENGIHDHKNDRYRQHDAHDVTEFHGEENQSEGNHHTGLHFHNIQVDGDAAHNHSHGDHTHAEPGSHDAGHGPGNCRLQNGNPCPGTTGGGDNLLWDFQHLTNGGGDADDTYRWHLPAHTVITDRHNGHRHPPGWDDSHHGGPHDHRDVTNWPSDWYSNDPNDGNYHPQGYGPAEGGFNVAYSPAGVACRNDYWSRGSDRKAPGTGAYIGNNDWDWGPGSFEGKEGYDDHNISAFVNPQINGLNSRWARENEEISDTWTSQNWNVSLVEKTGTPITSRSPQNPQQLETLYRNENQKGNLQIRGWASQQIHQGGITFTTGRWPGCGPDQFTLISPKPDPHGYNVDRRPIQNLDGNLEFVWSFGKSWHPNYQWAYSVAQVTDTAGNLVLQTRLDNANGWSPPGATRRETAYMGERTGTYKWRACASLYYTWLGDQPPSPGEARNISWNCSGYQNFTINAGPTAQILTPQNNGTVERCFQLSTRLTDADYDPVTPGNQGDQVTPEFTFAWSDAQGRNHNAKGESGRVVKGSGSTFSPSEVQVAEYYINGQAQNVPNQNLLQFMRERAPKDRRVNFTVRGADRYGASDLNGNEAFGLGDRAIAAQYIARAMAPKDTNQLETGFRWGAPSTVSILIGPNFANQSTKKFFDLNGNELQTVTDGQTVNVETRIVNGGESPAAYYHPRDYLGSIRDFEKPTNVLVRKNNGAQISVPSTRIAPVTPDQTNGNDTVLSEPVSPNAVDYRGAGWRIDLGDNQTGLPASAAFGGANNYLNPGDVITITYQVRANRNQQVSGGDDTRGEFGRRLDPGVKHFWITYQEELCDPANRVGQAVDVLRSTVVAPWVRGKRGSVGSNAGIFGYDALSGEQNATFLVQANGSISHFTSTTATMPNYSNPAAVCQAAGGRLGETPGGLDWRRDMIRNVIQLNASAKNPNINRLINGGQGQPRGNLNGPQGNVWVVGAPNAPQNLTISNPLQFSGTGTIVIFGDLTLADGANLTYAADTNGVNSLGVIVLGNLNIGSSVTNLVGSYYVSDVNFNPAPIIDNCPNIQANRGVIRTGASSLQLNVQGLMVARQFTFQRYFVNPTDSAADPAEDVYYDGRVLASTPPGFGTFRQTSAWYEIAP